MQADRLPADVTTVVRVVGEYGSSCGYCGKQEDPQEGEGGAEGKAGERRAETPTPVEEEEERENGVGGEEEEEEEEDDGPETSRSYGLLSDCMAPADYQVMMDVGWRRCGTFFYKPVMQATCCPQFTIRLDTHEFKISKSQKRVLRKVSKFLTSPAAGESTAAAGESTAAAGESTAAAAAAATASATSTPADAADPAATAAAMERLTVETVPADDTDERFQLYAKYQRIVHKDKPSKISRGGFFRFLVSNPFPYTLRLWDRRRKCAVDRPCPALQDASTAVFRERFPDGHGLPYGTYHQLYRLDGTLVAVGVIDLLPSCVSSVYCFYDPDYTNDLQLGKYSALKEIEWTREEAKVRPDIHYYYMGYYIHRCQKMRYKGDYRPSQLLCPVTMQWRPLAECSTLLERFDFTPLEPGLAQLRAALEDRAQEKRTELLRSRETGNDNGNGDGNENENGNDGTAVPEPRKDGSIAELKSFTPRMPGGSSPVGGIPLDVGAGRLVAVHHLTEQGQRAVKDILAPYIEVMPAALAQRTVVKLA